MLKLLSRARARFAADQRGNIGILFGFAAIPLIGLLGGAVDLTRHSRYEVTLANAMDAAAIALVRRGASDKADADAFVNDYIAGLAPWLNSDRMLHLARFEATKIDGGYRVEAKGSMDTAFLPVVGLRSMPLDLSTEVMMSAGKYEVALALDNTGSMDRHGRMKALRAAAGQLVDDLYREEDAEDRVKMALVPFVTTVNINAPGEFEMSWIEPTGDPAVYGQSFSRPESRLDLFNRMRTPWKGCVEARAGSLDEEDTPPENRQTRWVPYLWPDEPDSGYGNSYLPDMPGDRDAWTKLRNVDKYAVRPTSDTTVRGPNAGCPRALVPLTNDRERVRREINLMKPHNAVHEGNHTGTNVAQGLMWAWRVLSPEKPFDRDVAPYDDSETTKVLVLLSDGRNQVVGWEDRVTQSDYTSYGYLSAGRLGYTRARDFERAEQTVDGKVSRICEKVKAKGIRLYTILFQVDFAKTQDLFRACASKGEDGQPLYYYVPAPDQLEAAFRDIGEDLTTLRIAR